MPERLPEHAELYFVETVYSGTVHIEVRVPVWWRATSEPTETIKMGDGTGRALKALLETPTVVQCGRETYPHAETKHQFTTRFHDGQLCGRCYRTLHSEDQARAFEHEQPGDEDAEFDELLEVSSVGAAQVEAAREEVPPEVQEELRTAARKASLRVRGAEAFLGFMAERDPAELERLRQDAWASTKRK
ncbi:hypothetical protein [Streptomyces sp. MH60]|uniref:hypothetical protein n=1 Tax=Streptomyces sp. MH60 TaxID=1940758 RepID=UPI000CEDEAB4|nr:hypothetical protein [Streptomyces sp. MH60]PPS89424.1 hypothetical protein BZZ08_01570 [Streptomyces sp. MH60]